MSSPTRPARCWGLLALVLAVHALQLMWIAAVDRTLPYLAIADHAGRALAIRDDLIELVACGHGRIALVCRPWIALDVVIDRCQYRPPLAMLAALPALWHRPDPTFAACVAGLGWTALLLASTLALGARLASPAAGLAGATVLGAFPSVLGHRCVLMPFLPEAALVAASAAALVAARAGWRAGWVWLGIWSGLGMLVRWDCAVYLAALGAWHLATTARARRLEAALVWLAAQLVAGLVCGGWYLVGAYKLVRFYWGQGVVAGVHPHDGIPLLSLTNLFYLPTRLIGVHAGPVLGTLALVGAVRLVRRAHPFVPLGAWWLGLSWAFLLVVPMKGARYWMPALPPVALAVAIAADGLPRRRLCLGALTALALVLQVAQVHVHAVALAWRPEHHEPACWGAQPDLWEASLDAGRMFPIPDPTWRRAVDGIARAAGAPFAQPAEIVLADPGATEYLAALALVRRLRLRWPSDVERADLAGALALATHIVVTTPESSLPSEHLVRLRAAALVEVARRDVLFAAPLPDRVRTATLYGPRVR